MHWFIEDFMVLSLVLSAVHYGQTSSYWFNHLNQKVPKYKIIPVTLTFISIIHIWSNYFKISLLSLRC